jgi:CTP synthase
MKAAGELKTKPTQHSVQELRRIGITPNLIVARSEKPLPKSLKKKLAMSCDVDSDAVIEALDAPSIYQIPINFLQQKILSPIGHALDLGDLEPNMGEWNALVKQIISPTKEVSIAFVGKYLDLKESYKSLTESLIHAGAHLDTKVVINWIDSENLDEESIEELKYNDGILVAGGFGNRGVEGKIRAIQYARENKVPYLGICLGMQLAIIEFARNVLGIEDATSIEFDPETKSPLIYLIDTFLDQSGVSQLRTHTSPMGGTMRLGAYSCETKEGSHLRKAYHGEKIIFERHRHRYEANPAYRQLLKDAGMDITGESNGLIEAVEVSNHPWFLGVQFHPEFTSRLQRPNPSVLAFVQASMNK